jgi:pimeloyl-ACP methyl ester carboxylesterase
VPSILLLHGVMSSHANLWRSQRDLEDLGWSVDALDLPGHGHRQAVEGSADSVDAMAFDVAERLENGRVDIVAGHSLGAVVALRLARLCSDLVGGVVIEDPPGLASIDPAQVAIQVEAAVQRAERDAEAEIASILVRNPLWARRDAEGAVAGRRVVDVGAVSRFLRSQRWDLPALVADCPAPIQLIAATEPDTALRDPDRAVLIKMLGPARVRVVESGHSVHSDRPGLWLVAVLNFASSQADPGPRRHPAIRHHRVQHVRNGRTVTLLANSRCHRRHHAWPGDRRGISAARCTASR